ncbi:MAG: protein kinase [bacterium]
MSTELHEKLQEALGGVYVLERELGGGGMSRVFLARDDALSRRIVVKLLPPEMAATVNIERFRREIQLAASLMHPHLIPLLSAGEVLGLPYFTMPYIEGESLRARLLREGQFAVREAVRLGIEVARALDYAHRSGIVHRDMKPDNVLTHDGHALVTDFGIARAINESANGVSLTSVGMVIGTPAYMSPEQCGSGHAIDNRSDIYALACVLYEMLAGRPPFSGMSATTILMMHRTAPVPSVRALRPEVPEAIDRALTKALAKEPSERFNTAAEFAEVLEGAASSYLTPGFTRATSPPERAAAGAPTYFVVVLPFANMSADPENEYFSDGITEDIIAQLSRIRGLRVMSRTSAMRYKDHPESVRDIHRETGVSHVLEGSVRKAGSRLRIVAQLIDARSDEHIWAETWDREMDDVFAIQSEVAEHIAETLHTRLTSSERSIIAKKPTDDIEAYNLYLLGRHHYNKVTPEDFGKALGYFRQAIDRDPTFARAYASLAEALLYLGLGYWGVRPREMMAESFALATKALALDPHSAEAHASLSMYHSFHEFRWEKATYYMARAVELNPSASMIRMYYAIEHCAYGRFDEAMVQRELACQLDPSAMVIRGNATWVLYLARRMEQAVAECRTLRSIDPTSAYGAFSHGLVCAQSGDAQEAIGAFRDALSLSNNESLYSVMLAYALAVGGEQEESRAILAQLHAREEQEFIWPMGLAFAYAHLGEESKALDYLESAYEERVGWMLMLGREPALDVLRGAPRFQALLQRIGPAQSRRSGASARISGDVNGV